MQSRWFCSRLGQRERFALEEVVRHEHNPRYPRAQEALLGSDSNRFCEVLHFAVLPAPQTYQISISTTKFIHRLLASRRVPRPPIAPAWFWPLSHEASRHQAPGNMQSHQYGQYGTGIASHTDSLGYTHTTYSRACGSWLQPDTRRWCTCITRLLVQETSLCDTWPS